MRGPRSIWVESIRRTAAFSARRVRRLLTQLSIVSSRSRNSSAGRSRLASDRVERAGALPPAQQAERAAVRLQAGDQRAQALLAAQAGGQQAEKVHAAGEATLVVVGVVATHHTVEMAPGKRLDDLLENGGMVAHGIGSAAVDNVGKRLLRIRIN